MKKIFYSLLLAIGAIFVSTNLQAADEDDDSWDVFLLFGQSNMEGGAQGFDEIDKNTNSQIQLLAYNNNYGRSYNQWYTATAPLHGTNSVSIGDWFAKTLVDSLNYTRTIALVPCAISGVDIDFFRKGVRSSRRNEFQIPPDNHWTSAYDFMIERLQIALKKGKLKGILLHQGESDSGQQVWLTKVQGIIADLKTDLGITTDIPVLVGEIPRKSVCAGHNSVIAQIPNYVPNCKVISSNGLNGMTDSYHFDKASYRQMGARYAHAYMGMIGITSNSDDDNNQSNSNNTKQELIENGEFDNGTTSWQSQFNSNTSGNVSVTNANMSGSNALEICPNANNFGTEGWHIQVYQNTNIKSDVEYSLTFTAKASASRTLNVMIQKVAADYDVYKSFDFNLTTSPQTFTETFTLSGNIDPSSKLTFCIGGNANCVYIDNVSFGTKSSDDNNNNQGDDDDNNQDPLSEIGENNWFIDKAYVGPSCDVLQNETANNRGAYYTGIYPNLFTQYLGKTQTEVDAKMESIWKHFYTAGGQNTVYYETNDGMAYIYDTGNGDVRTEGMSYGLMICVQLGHQTEFDKIWRWAKKYMQYKAGDQREGLFAWQCGTDGKIKGASCAPDGEMYFLTALWFASHRWGNDGAINYEQEAQYLAKMILDKPNRAAGQVSPIFNMTYNLVTFGETSYTLSDPSYNLPGFLELWARWSNTNTEFWAKTPSAARDLLYNAADKNTGLYPDYCEFSGAASNPSWHNDYDAKRYQYDAIRCPMNVGMDYNWFAADSRQATMIRTILNFFKKDNFMHGQFDLNGNNASGSYSEGMSGANGVGVLALTESDNELAKLYVEKLWNTNPPSGQWRYYNGMVYMLSMLHASGNFKIFKPIPEIYKKTVEGNGSAEYQGKTYTESTKLFAIEDCKLYEVSIEIADNQIVEQTIDLQKGWNLFSLNVVPDDNSIASIFDDTDVITIMNEDAYWNISQNPIFNGFDKIEPGKGYLVYMNSAATLSVSGTKIDQMSWKFDYHQGWNLIGCPYQFPNNFFDLYKSSDTEIVKDFDGFWVPGDNNSSITKMQPSKAYFVKRK